MSKKYQSQQHYNNIRVGDVVLLKDGIGTIEYIGSVHFASGSFFLVLFYSKTITGRCCRIQCTRDNYAKKKKCYNNILFIKKNNSYNRYLVWDCFIRI